MKHKDEERAKKAIEFDCYRDQFNKILRMREPRLAQYSHPIVILFYFSHKIPESQAVDKFIESRISLIP
jgi:hypothetical protein